MKLRKLLSVLTFVSFILGCESKKTLKMTEKEIQTLDSLGYKIYQYKKDKQGNYYVDSTYNKFLDTNNSN